MRMFDHMVSRIIEPPLSRNLGGASQDTAPTRNQAEPRDQPCISISGHGLGPRSTGLSFWDIPVTLWLKFIPRHFYDCNNEIKIDAT